MGDAFDAGSDTVNYSLRWIIHLLARFPDAAREMQAQIDEAIPKHQMVSSQDKQRFLFNTDIYVKFQPKWILI